MQYAVVFYRRNEQVLFMGGRFESGSDEGKVACFRAAGSEANFRRLRPDRPRKNLTRFIQSEPRLTPPPVKAGRVAETLVQERLHRLAHLRV